MKKLLKKALALAIALCIIISCLSGCTQVKVTEIGNPHSERFTEGEFACTAWDMTVWNGKLYIGGGDYDLNKGPTDIWSYDVEEKEWVKSGRVNGEQVSRFTVIGDKLFAPGIDTRGVDWEHTDQDFYGDYYSLDGEEWTAHDKLPGAIHNFDMVECNGKIFAGLGIKNGAKAVACSSDGGETFQGVEFFKDGDPVDTAGSEFIRVYELFVKDNQTYALLRYGERSHYELFRYDGEKFDFYSDWSGKFYGAQPTYDLFSGKAVVNGKVYFAYGNLFSTEDMDTIERVSVKDGAMIVDLAVIGGRLFVLCLEREQEEYRISVWVESKITESGFREVFYFNYEIPVLSFAYHKSHFYFGAGSRTVMHEKNGNVLCVRYKV